MPGYNPTAGTEPRDSLDLFNQSVPSPKDPTVRYSIAYPKDTDEQEEIVAYLSALDDKLALAERKSAHFEELFKTLLHQLMTAQLRVNDLDLDALGVPTLD